MGLAHVSRGTAGTALKQLREQPPGLHIVPTAEDLDLDGLDVAGADVQKALAVDPSEWRKELPLIEEWFEFVGDKLPTGVKDEFEALKQRLAESD